MKIYLIMERSGFILSQVKQSIYWSKDINHMKRFSFIGALWKVFIYKLGGVKVEMIRTEGKYFNEVKKTTQ